MTNEREQELRDIVEVVVNGLVKILVESGTEIEFRKPRSTEQIDDGEGVENIVETSKAERGTCPECGNMYAIRKNGSLRRHGEGNCYLQTQCPKEISEAILLVSRIDEREENGRENNGTGDV